MINILKQAEKDLREAAGLKTEEDHPIEISTLETKTHLVEELKTKDNEFVFAIFNKETGELENESASDYKIDNLIFIPSQDDIFTKNLIKLPSKVNFVTEDVLNQAIRDVVSAYYWLDEKTYFLGISYAKYTWIHDLYWTVPFYGPWGAMGTGKTRHIDTIGALCRKPLSVSGAISEAFMYRIMDKHAPTLIINEFDRMNSDDKSLLTAILNNAYEKNHPIPKMEGEGKNMKTKLWNVFGPKIFATLDRFKSDALESRTIRINAQEFPKENRNDYPIELSEDFFEWVKEIHNMLIGYRFKYFASHLQDKKRVQATLEKEGDSQKLRLMRVCELDILEGGERRKTFLDVSDFDSRTRQTFYPLLRVIKDNEIDDFIKYAKEYQEELIQQRSQDTIGIIVNTILSYIEVNKLSYSINSNDPQYVPVKEIRLAISKELYGETENEITKESKPLKEISPQYMGSLLRKLKIKTEKRGHDNNKYLVLDNKIIDFLKKRYFPSPPRSQEG